MSEPRDSNERDTSGDFPVLSHPVRDDVGGGRPGKVPDSVELEALLVQQAEGRRLVDGQDVVGAPGEVPVVVRPLENRPRGLVLDIEPALALASAHVPDDQWGKLLGGVVPSLRGEGDQIAGEGEKMNQKNLIAIN